MVRRSGILPTPLSKLSATTCVCCKLAQEEIDRHGQLFANEIKNLPTSVRRISRAYPLWCKYVLEKEPDVPVRILVLHHTLPVLVVDHFRIPKKPVQTDDIPMWVFRYLLLVVQALPPSISSCSNGRVAKLIGHYADPSLFHFCAVKMVPGFDTAVIPHAKPSDLRRVEGWSPAALTLLQQAPPTTAFQFCAPLGYRVLWQHVRQVLADLPSGD